MTPQGVNIACDFTRHAPNLGEHTVEILREAGFSGAEIDGLLRARVVGAAPAAEREFVGSAPAAKPEP